MKKILIVAVLMLAACAPVVPPTPVPPTVTPVVTLPPPPTQPSPNATWLPNPDLTPGALNPDVTVATEGQTICVSGWTKTVRPPYTYTDALKVKQLADPRYGDTGDQSTADYEEDHLIPLELGGNPTSELNLWPQPRNTSPWNAGIKDQFENQLKLLVCAGQLDLATAQAAIATDWVAAYHQYYPAAQLIAPTIVPPEP